MDPITAAIVAALPALASGVVKDAYDGLKAVIRRKWGDAHPVAKAVDALEANPKSQGRAAVLSESVAEAKATDDPDIMHALTKLLDEMKKQGVGGSQAIEINISGGNVQGVVGAQSVSVGSMSFGAPAKDTKS